MLHSKAFVAMAAVSVAGAFMTGCGASPPTPPQTAQANAPAQWPANGQGITPAANPTMAPATRGWRPPIRQRRLRNPAARLASSAPGAAKAQVRVASVTAPTFSIPTGRSFLFHSCQRDDAACLGPLSSHAGIALPNDGGVPDQGVLPQQICAQRPWISREMQSLFASGAGPETVQFTSPTTSRRTASRCSGTTRPTCFSRTFLNSWSSNARAPVPAEYSAAGDDGRRQIQLRPPPRTSSTAYMRGCTQNAQGSGGLSAVASGRLRTGFYVSRVCRRQSAAYSPPLASRAAWSPRSTMRPRRSTSIWSASTMVERAVGDDPGWCALPHLAQGGLDRRLGGAVEGAGGFVEHQQARTGQQRRARPTRWRSPPESFSPRSPTRVSSLNGSDSTNAASSAASTALHTSASLASGSPKAMLASRVSLNSATSCGTRATARRIEACFTSRRSTPSSRTARGLRGIDQPQRQPHRGGLAGAGRADQGGGRARGVRKLTSERPTERALCRR